MISEIRIVTISVSDLERSIDFYKASLGFVELGRSLLDIRTLQQPWRIPQGLNGRMSILAADGKTTGMLRIVDFEKNGEPIFTQLQNYGHCYINYRVRDLKSLWPRVLKAGAIEKSPPTYWKLKHNVWDAQAADPDGILIDIFEIECDPDDPIGQQVSEVSELQTMAIHVADAQRSKKFYMGLGFTLFYDKIVDNMEEFFGVPQGTKLHNINLKMPYGTPNGRIEIAQYIGFPGESVRDRAVPPNKGILSISFETDNLIDTCELVRNLGGNIIGGPVETKSILLGAIQLATFFGPDGEVLEFYQKI